MKIVEKFGFPTIRPEDINEYGTRFQIPTTLKPIIVCLGCSFTYGYTDETKTWPYLLETKLESKYQVLNMGRRNYGLKLLVDWYDVFASKLCPYMCVIQLPNFNRQPHPKFQEDSSVHYTEKYGSSYASNISDFIEVMHQLMEQDLNRLMSFANLLRSNGVIPVVVLYKSMDGKFHYGQDLYYEMIKGSGLEVIVDSKLDWSYLKENNMLHSGKHPNEIGNDLIADVVLNKIRGCA